MKSLSGFQFLLIHSLLVSSLFGFRLLNILQNNEPITYTFNYISMMSPLCERLINQKSYRVISANQPNGQFDYNLKQFCKTILEENSLAEEAKQREIEKNEREMKEEQRAKIYRTHLASKVKSSIVTDFLTMRYNN